MRNFARRETCGEAATKIFRRILRKNDLKVWELNPRARYAHIKNFKKENIGSCKYRFRLGEIFKHEKIDVIEIDKNKLPELKKVKLPYVLKPGEFVIGRTMEEFDTPLELMSIYSASSTSVRIGLHIAVGGINDPGYKGNAIMGIHNISINNIKLFEGMELLHTAFLELKGTAIPVQTKYMGGKIL